MNCVNKSFKQFWWNESRKMGKRGEGAIKLNNVFSFFFQMGADGERLMMLEREVIIESVTSLGIE